MEEKRVALVTGSRKGIGKYLAERLAESGYQVVGCSRKPVVWSLDNYQHFYADSSDEKQVKELFRMIRKKYGRLDVTVNNAGTASMNHFLLTPVETVTQIVETNVRGTFLISRESAKLMRKHHFGRIVNLTTVAVPMKLKGEAIYAASKSAVETLTVVMSKELAEFGITVNAIGPSPIETDLIKGISKEKIDSILGQLAIKRLGQPEDVFNVLDFFIRPESEYVTGQIIYLGGA